MSSSEKPKSEFLSEKADSIAMANAFVDAAVNTMLPRLRELKTPHALKADGDMAQLMKMMFLEGETDVRIFTERQASLLAVILPEIVEELRRLDCENFEEMSRRIYSVVLGITETLEAGENRSAIAERLSHKGGR